MLRTYASTIVAISLLSISASCGDDGDRAGNPCDLADCTDPACEPIRATPVDTLNSCATAHEQLVGCRPRAAACAPVVTYARDEQSETWQLETDCLPPGWTEFPAVHAPQFLKPGLCLSPDIESTCEALDVEGCNRNADCMPLYARPLDVVRGCFETFARHVACVQLQPCHGRLSYAFEPGYGRAWEFEGGCLPASWQARSGATLIAGTAGAAPPPCP